MMMRLGLVTSSFWQLKIRYLEKRLQNATAAAMTLEEDDRALLTQF